MEKKIHHSYWLGKLEESNFVSSGNQPDWRLITLMVSRCDCHKAQRGLCCSWREGMQTTCGHTEWKQESDEHLRHMVGKLFAHLRAHPREASFMERRWYQGTS